MPCVELHCFVLAATVILSCIGMWGESSRERYTLLQGVNVPCNLTKVPGSKSTRERKFHLWYFRSWEQKNVGMKVP